MLGQSVQPMEIIVMDDASTDNSIEVIESFARRHPIVRLHRNERNLGVVVNVNLGIDLARGDYIFSAAADDEVVPGFFEKSLSLLATHPAAALSATITEFREAQTGVRWLWGGGVVESPTYLSPAQIVECERKGTFYIPPNSVIFRTTALREVGNFIPELKFCCDWYAMYLAGFRHGICFVPEPLAIFHVQANSYYHKIRRDKAEYRRVLELLLERLNQPENREVLGFIREGGSLFLYGIPMLRLLLSRPEYRHLISPTFLRKNLSHSAKLLLKNHSPAFLVNSYLKLSGNRKRTTAESPQNLPG
jgi:glycosyltransferase involved in cell wall biosynthesis